MIYMIYGLCEIYDNFSKIENLKKSRIANSSTVTAAAQKFL